MFKLATSNDLTSVELVDLDELAGVRSEFAIAWMAT